MLRPLQQRFQRSAPNGLFVLLCVLMSGCPSFPQLPGGLERPICAEKLPLLRGYELTQGESVRIQVEQLGQDVGLVLMGGGLNLAIDHQVGALVPEVLWFRAPVDATYQLRVHAVGGIVEDGKFAVGEQRFGPNEPGASQIAEAFLEWRAVIQAEAETDRPSGEERFADLSERSAETLLRLADRMENQGERVLAGRMAMDAARAYGSVEDAQRQTGAFSQALRHFLDAGEPTWAMYAAGRTATAYRDTGLFEMAIASGELAIELAALTNHAASLGNAHNNLGRTYSRMGRFEDAIQAYRTALSVYKEAGLAGNTAITQFNIALDLIQVGRWTIAETNLRSVLAYWQGQTRPDKIAKAKLELGWLAHLQGKYDDALTWYDQARQAQQQAGESSAGLLDRWGSTLTALGRFDLAEAKYREALSLFEGAGDDANAAHVWINLAKLLCLRGQAEQALPAVTRGLQFFNGRRAVIEAANAMRIQGNALALIGSLADADRTMSQGLTHLNRVISGTSNYLLARSFTDVYYGVITDLADLRMRRHALDADGGYSRQAFEMLERQRALTLRRQIQNQDRPAATTHAWDRHLQQGPGTSHRPSRAIRDLLHAELFDQLFEHYQSRQQARALTPMPTEYSMAALQDFLREDQVALVFSLHPHQGYLWELTAEAFMVHTLPGEGVIAAVVEPLHHLLSKPAASFQRQQRKELIEKATKLLLSRTQLAKTKTGWLIIPQGILNLLPWTALQDPTFPGDRLVQHRTVTLLPSLSTGLDLRQRALARTNPAKSLLAFGGAVYEPPQASDYPAPVDQPEIATYVGNVRADFSKNLPHSRAEVETIAAMLPEAQTKVVLGTAVDVESLDTSALSAYRLLHFAMHGFHHPDFGDLSSLVFSTVDDSGHRRNGMVEAIEIQDWQLCAELVTLSACHTGLGEAFQGEGIWGLGQAMMIAGASRVVTSLWAVRDETTKKLMVAFYRNLLVDGLAPPHALRAAQVALASEEPTADPYYWAGFVHQGLSDPLREP